MKVYLVSLGAGLLVGVVYSLLDVRSPAPPVVRADRPARPSCSVSRSYRWGQMISGSSIGTAWQQMRCGHHIFGGLPGGHADPPGQTRTSDAREAQS